MLRADYRSRTQSFPLFPGLSMLVRELDGEFTQSIAILWRGGEETRGAGAVEGIVRTEQRGFTRPQVSSRIVHACEGTLRRV